jgi:hypothetical protein
LNLNRVVKQCCVYLWVSPITLAGVVFAIFIRATGGNIVKHGIAWEAYNGCAAKLLWLLNPWMKIDAITIGHIIIARDELAATRLRAHEHAHVRQYERWGVAFPFAYVIASIIAVTKGGDAYRDNVFEGEARRAEAHR